MSFEEALAILSAVGTDNAPSLEDLETARSVLVSGAKAAQDARDKKALATMLDGIRLADQAIKEAKDALAAEAEELAALVSDVPELAAAPEVNEPAHEEPSGKVLSLEDAAARLGLRATTEPEVAEVTETPARTTLEIDGENVPDADWDSLATAFAKATRTTARTGRTTLATVRTDFVHQAPGKVDENTRLLDAIYQASTDTAIVAAGGCCTIAEPLRDIPVLSHAQRPIASALPTVGVTHGKLVAWPALCMPGGGAGAWDCTDQEAVDPDDADTWKTCSEVECDTPVEFDLYSTYRCLTINNFNHRFSPERWKAALQQVLAVQARLAEQKLYAALPATDALTAQDTGNIFTSMALGATKAMSAYKSQQRVQDRRFKWILPAWLEEFANLDLEVHATQRGITLDGGVTARFAKKGIDIVWSDDRYILPDVAARDIAYPSSIAGKFFADGDVFRLDGGTLDLGTEIRDHELNRQNTLAAFAEGFEGVMFRGCNAYDITVPIDVCATIGCGTAAPDVTVELDPTFNITVEAGGDTGVTP